MDLFKNVNLSGIVNHKISVVWTNIQTAKNNHPESLKDNDLWIFCLASILIPYIPNIELSDENKKILPKAERLFSPALEHFAEQTIYNLYENNLTERIAFWTNDNLDALKIKYINEEIERIDHILEQPESAKQNMVIRFAEHELKFFHSREIRNSRNELTAVFKNIHTLKTIGEQVGKFPTNSLTNIILGVLSDENLLSELPDKEDFELLLKKSPEFVANEIIRQLPIQQISDIAHSFFADLADGFAPESREFKYIYMPYFKAIMRFKEALLQSVNEAKRFVAEKTLEQKKAQINTLISEILASDKLNMPKILADSIIQNAETKPFIDKYITPKIETDLTVGQITLLFRLLDEDKLLIYKNKTDIFRFIVKTFSSKRIETLSELSVKNRFTSPDVSEIEFWTTELVRFKQILQKL